MTTITNLVVALMIVTSGEEPVRAIPYTPETRICGVDTQYLNPIAAGAPETLYRKTCKTNFVYSSTIHVDHIQARCKYQPYCHDLHTFTIEELFGCPVYQFFVEYDGPIYCDKHMKEMGWKVK